MLGGDGKMSALGACAYRAGHQNWYVSPVPLAGVTAGAMDAWIAVEVTTGEAGTLCAFHRATPGVDRTRLVKQVRSIYHPL